eukprot:2579441-Pyramimonas_sp.AAC.1
MLYPESPRVLSAVGPRARLGGRRAEPLANATAARRLAVGAPDGRATNGWPLRSARVRGIAVTQPGLQRLHQLLRPPHT